MRTALLALALMACNGEDPVDTDDVDTSEPDTDASTDVDTGSDTDTDTDTDAAPHTFFVFAQGWEEQSPFAQSIVTGPPIEMTELSGAGGEAGAINTMQQTPSYSAPEGEWTGYLQVRPPNGGGQAVAELETVQGIYVVGNAGESHTVRIRYGRSIAVYPSGSLRMSLLIDGEEVASELAPEPISGGLGNYSTHLLTYTTEEADVGGNMQVSLVTTETQGGTYSLLIDDLLWNYTF